MSNSALAQFTPQQVFNSERMKRKFEEVLGSKAKGFVTSMLQLINTNDKLAQCDSESVYSSAMTSALLDLPINPNLGFAYIIPYYNTRAKKYEAQFQMGYKGYIQLCQRSGLFETISCAEIYEGQLIEEDPLQGFRFDFTQKTSDKVIGYASYFRLLNGFQKVYYMSEEDIITHAKRYSQSFKGDKIYGVWKDNFDGMAKKTVLKLLLSKYAPMTVDIERAMVHDQGVSRDPNAQEVSYPDNPQSAPEQNTVSDANFIEEEDPKVVEPTGKSKIEIKDLEKETQGTVFK